MSRTAFGFPKILWNYARYGMLEHGPKSVITVDGSWHQGESRLRRGDRIGQIVLHERGGVVTESREVWRVEKVSKTGSGNRWDGEFYRIKFRRTEME